MSIVKPHSASAMLQDARRRCADRFEEIEAIEAAVQRRMIRAFQRARVRQVDLQGTTGYGYDDPARERLEEVFASVFQSEAAIVRPQIASGTHAHWICLDALLRPGDQLIAATGAPYETLRNAIAGAHRHSLVSRGVHYSETPLKADGSIDYEALAKELGPKTRLVLAQRSKGYGWRRAMTVQEIGELWAWLKERSPQALLLVDNCYGEFVEAAEPPAYGVELIAGSLIKNPGGTLAPAGGYIAGRREVVEEVADRVTAPGLGLKVGPSLGTAKSILQGVFLAPHFVAESLAGLAVAAAVLDELGYATLPRAGEASGDSVLAVKFGDPRLQITFCQAVQNASPVDADAVLEPSELPGYDVKVIMAAGTFIQGSSSELSADGPVRPPYAAFLQGGTSRTHILYALERAVEALLAP